MLERFSLSPSNRYLVFITTALLVAVYAFALNFFGSLYANTMTHDNVIFLDGIYRLSQGHTPHIDFISALGPLNYYGSYWLNSFFNNIISSFLAYNTLVTIGALLIASYISYTRLNNFCSIILLFYTAALVGAPCNIGEDEGRFVTHAMFYNRFGWAFLSLGFLLTLQGHRQVKHPDFVESALISFILIFLFYTKATYFLSLLGIYGLVLLFYPKEFMVKAIICIATLLIVCISIEAIKPGLHIAYAHDLIRALQAKANDVSFFDALKDNSVYIACIALAAYGLLPSYQSQNQQSFHKHTGVLAALGAISLLIITTNAQKSGLPTIVIALIGLLVAADKMLISKYSQRIKLKKLEMQERHAILACYAMLAFLALPEIIDRQSALERFFRHNYVAQSSQESPSLVRLYDNFIVKEGSYQPLQSFVEHGGKLALDEFYQLSKQAPRQEIHQTEYVYTVNQGANLLQNTMDVYGQGSIINLDFANPFSLALHSAPAKGEYLWYHHKLNISASEHLSPESLFANAKYISIPEYPVNRPTRDFLVETYQPYIEQNYVLIKHSTIWQVWMKKELFLAYQSSAIGE